MRAMSGAPMAIRDCQADTQLQMELFARMSNTWKGKSTQNQEATLEVMKDNFREKAW